MSQEFQLQHFLKLYSIAGSLLKTSADNYIKDTDFFFLFCKISASPSWIKRCSTIFHILSEHDGAETNENTLKYAPLKKNLSLSSKYSLNK